VRLTVLTLIPTLRELNRRLGQYAGLGDVPGALAWALREMGVTLADTLTIADADLATISDAHANQLLDYAQDRAMLTVAENVDAESLRNYGISEDIKDVRSLFERKIERFHGWLKVTYGYGLPTVGAGVANLNFAASCDDESVM
jgi:hypothetical protein